MNQRIHLLLQGSVLLTFKIYQKSGAQLQRKKFKHKIETA